MKPKCETRNHRWDTADRKGKPGATCLDCHQVYGERHRRTSPAATGPAVHGDYLPPPAGHAAKGANEALREKWGLGNAAQPAQEPQTPTPQAQSKTEPPKEDDSAEVKVDLTELLRGEIPDIIVAGEQKAIKHWFHREPADPADLLMKKLEEALDKLSLAKVPKIALSPGWAMVAISLLIGVQMGYQGKPIPQPAKDTARGGATAAGTGETEMAPEPTPSSSLTPKLTLVQENGNANGANSSSSEE